MKYWNKEKKKKKSTNCHHLSMWNCTFFWHNTPVFHFIFQAVHTWSWSYTWCFHYWFWTNLNVKNLLPHHISYANFHWCSGVPIFLSHICLLPPSEHWCYDQLKNYFTLGKYISTALCMHISHYCFKVIVNKLLKILFIF